MEYICYNMNAYNLHIVNTKKFKTITVDICFREKINKDEITLRNLLKEIMVNASYDYPSERELIKATEELYDLKLLTSTYRIGNYNFLSMKIRFLNEKYTEKGMNYASIKLLLDLIFKPKLDADFEKCKNKIEKSILSLNDNKVKYAISKLLESTKDMPYSYNFYGNIEDLNKITIEDIKKCYENLLTNDIIDIFVVGEVNPEEIKNIFKENFKVKTFHKVDNKVIVKELTPRAKTNIIREQDDINQIQLTILCSLNSITEYERKYVSLVYSEMLGGSANSILFDTVREKKSYAYYVNSIIKPYDNNMIIYSGIHEDNEKEVIKLIKKCLKDITKGKFNDEIFLSSKNTIISSLKASLDNPIGIINNCLSNILVSSPTIEEKIKIIEKITKEEVINFSKKITIHTIYILEGSNEENNNQ
ncbi:peptidase M16 domain protein [Clostridium sp. CAG:914]|jgi:predicted Zn-dependent peptidase|nr:peptidase M16 domain protein [Clostridium sp. CAG:914]